MSKLLDGRGNDNGFGFRRLTSPAARGKSTIVNKMTATVISEAQFRLSAIKYRVRRGMSSFPDTEEIELYKLVFREIDEVLQRSEEELSRGNQQGCRQYIALAESFLTDAETKIDTLSKKSKSMHEGAG